MRKLNPKHLPKDFASPKKIRIRLAPADRKAELLICGARMAETVGFMLTTHGQIAMASQIHCSVATVFVYFNHIEDLRDELAVFILESDDLRYPKASIEAYVYLARRHGWEVDDFLTKFSIRAYLDEQENS